MNRYIVFILVVMVFSLSFLSVGLAIEHEVMVAKPMVGKEPVTTAASRFKNIEGTLKEIQGNVYVLEENAEGESIRVEVGKDTAFPNGQKKPGQLIQVLITSVNQHALIIR